MIAIALVVPVLGLPLAWRAPTAALARRWIGWLALALAALWFVVLLADDHASAGRFGAGGAPAAIATWLLLATITWPARRLLVAVGVMVAGVAAAGASLLAGSGDLSDAGGALAVAAALVVLAARLENERGLALAALSVSGAAGVALGLARLESATGGFERGGGALVALGAAAIVLGAGARARRTGVVLLPLALTLAVQADASPRIAVACAAVALLLTRRPATSLGLWAVAAATISPPAGVLLGAAAVVSAAWLHPLTPLVALPGAAALAFVAAQEGSATRLALGLLGALTVARLWSRDDGDVVAVTPAPASLAAIGIGTWLLLAPETWAIADAPGLASWGTGVAWTAVAAAVGAFVAASFTETTFSLPALEVADPAYEHGDPRWARRASVVALAVLGLAGARLVASVLS